MATSDTDRPTLAFGAAFFPLAIANAHGLSEASDVSGVWPGRRVWVANEICPLTATDLPAVVTTGRG
jgi:hypothetical protein